MKENKLKNDVAKFMDDNLYIMVMPKSKVVCLAMIESKSGMRPVQTENSFKRYSDGMFFIHSLFYKDGTSISLKLCLEEAKNRDIFERLVRQNTIEYISFSRDHQLDRIMGAINSIKIFAQECGYEF